MGQETMKVLVYEENLLWSSRFVGGLRKMGHESAAATLETDPAGADVAIVNLGHPEFARRAFVERLQLAGVRVVGHAGHKETDLLELGRDAGCDVVATNGQITHRLDEVLAAAVAKNIA